MTYDPEKFSITEYQNTGKNDRVKYEACALIMQFKLIRRKQTIQPNMLEILLH